MGFGQWREYKNFSLLVSKKNDLKLSAFFADEFLPKMNDDIRKKGNNKGSNRRRRKRRTNSVQSFGGNGNRYMVFIRPEDTHLPYNRPKWCFLNNVHLNNKEKCFNCVDFAINKIIEKFLELKMQEHTLMVIYPDHIPFGAHFNNNHLFILFPGIEKIKNRINRSVSYYDLAPTVLGMIGVKEYLPIYPFGRNIYNINNSEKLKHDKPDANDLDMIDINTILNI